MSEESKEDQNQQDSLPSLILLGTWTRESNCAAKSHGIKCGSFHLLTSTLGLADILTNQ